MSLQPGGRGFVALVTALIALGSVSVSIYLPSMPAIARAFSATPATIKLTLTVFLVALALSQLVMGPLSDRFGRRPVLLAALACYLGGTLACAIAGSAAMLIVSRAVQAIGASAGPSIGRAMTRDAVAPEALGRVMATMAAVIALSPMVGPLIGGILEVRYAWRAAFWLLLAAGSLLAIVAAIALPETHVAPRASVGLREVVAHYRALLADPTLIGSLACIGALTAASFAWTAGAPFVFIEAMGVPPDRYGSITVIVGAGFLAGTVASVRLARRTVAPALRWGLHSAAAGAIALLAAASVPATGTLGIVAAMTVFSFGFGIAAPALSAATLAASGPAVGSAAALLGAGQIALGACGSALMSMVHVRDARPMAWIVAGCTTIALLCARRSRAAAAGSVTPLR